MFHHLGNEFIFAEILINLYSFLIINLIYSKAHFKQICLHWNETIYEQWVIFKWITKTVCKVNDYKLYILDI